jgi:hypothetical protein
MPIPNYPNRVRYKCADFRNKFFHQLLSYLQLESLCNNFWKIIFLARHDVYTQLTKMVPFQVKSNSRRRGETHHDDDDDNIFP